MCPEKKFGRFFLFEKKINRIGKKVDRKNFRPKNFRSKNFSIDFFRSNIFSKIDRKFANFQCFFSFKISTFSGENRKSFRFFLKIKFRHDFFSSRFFFLERYGHLLTSRYFIPNPGGLHSSAPKSSTWGLS